MNRFEYLFAGLMNQTEEVTLKANEYYDFNVKDRVVVIEQGEVLVITPPNPETGRSKRHVFTSRDPYGVADLPCRAVICGDAVEIGNDEIAPVDRVAVVPEDLQRVVGRFVRVISVRKKGRESVVGDSCVDRFDPPPLPLVEEWAGDIDEW